MAALAAAATLAARLVSLEETLAGLKAVLEIESLPSCSDSWRDWEWSGVVAVVVARESLAETLEEEEL